MSAKRVPSITKPAISAAVGRSAPRCEALAGMMGIRAYSPIENSEEGTKTEPISWLILNSLGLDIGQL
jgi:hypothetical protein